MPDVTIEIDIEECAPFDLETRGLRVPYLSGKWVTRFMGSAERFVVVTLTDASGTVEGLHISPLG